MHGVNYLFLQKIVNLSVQFMVAYWAGATKHVGLFKWSRQVCLPLPHKVHNQNLLLIRMMFFHSRINILISRRF